MVLEKLDIYIKKNEIGPLAYTTDNEQLNIDLRFKWRSKTIKLLEENRRKLPDIGFQKQRGKKAKIDKWDYIKLKRFCTTKVKNQWNEKAKARDWEKIFANYKVINIQNTESIHKAQTF